MRTFNILFFSILAGLVLWACQPTQKQYTTPDQAFISVDSLVKNVKAEVNVMSKEELKSAMDQEEMYILVDVRTPGEHNQGYILGSVNIPRGFLELRIYKESFWEDEGMYAPLKDDKLIVFCKSGTRSAFAAQTLEQMGFENVYSLDSGFTAWKKAYPDLIHSITPLISKPVQGNTAAAEEDTGGC